MKKIKYIFYFSIVVIFIANIVEIFSGVLLERRMRYSLSIFKGITKDSQNVLSTIPFFSQKWKTKEFDCSVRTNSRGYREDFEFKDSDVDVAFMGDSFTFGHGVDINSRYSNIAARLHPNIRIVSLSYNNGFQPEHYEYFIDQHLSLRPKLLFIGLYIGNDLDSDLNETYIKRDIYGKIIQLQLPCRDVYKGVLINRSSFKYNWLSDFVNETDTGKILAIKINSSYNMRKLFSKKESCLPNTGNRLSTELGIFDQLNLRAIISLKEIAKKIKSRNGKLHVLLIPQNFLIGKAKQPHVAAENMHMINELKSKNGLLKSIIALCDNEQLLCHDLSKFLTSDDYFEQDAHWNEKGHEKIGKYVSEIIELTEKQ